MVFGIFYTYYDIWNGVRKIEEKRAGIKVEGQQAIITIIF